MLRIKALFTLFFSISVIFASELSDLTHVLSEVNTYKASLGSKARKDFEEKLKLVSARFSDLTDLTFLVKEVESNLEEFNLLHKEKLKYLFLKFDEILCFEKTNFLLLNKFSLFLQFPTHRLENFLFIISKLGQEKGGLFIVNNFEVIPKFSLEALHLESERIKRQTLLSDEFILEALFHNLVFDISRPSKRKSTCYSNIDTFF